MEVCIWMYVSAAGFLHEWLCTSHYNGLFSLFVLLLFVLQGVIPLRFSKVNELPLNSDDPGKYLFEIVPRKHRIPSLKWKNGTQGIAWHDVCSYVHAWSSFIALHVFLSHCFFVLSSISCCF